MRKLNFPEKLLYVCTLLGAMHLLLSCLIYFTGISRFPLLGLISIFVPLSILFNLIFCVYWFSKQRRVFFLSLAGLLLSWIFLGPFYKINSVTEKISQDELSIMSFNARGFNRYQQIELPDLDLKIIEMVQSYNPDIICFQEFDFASAPELDMYPYQYVNHVFPEERKVIQAILSKYPITDKGTVSFPNSSNNTIYADIDYEGSLLRVYNVHLQSFKIIPTLNNILSEPGDQFFKRIKNTYLKQEAQAEIVREHVQANELPSIVCADLNSTPYSRVYRRIKGELEDSYEEQGSGLGTTFRLFQYPLRIDYIFADPTLEIVKHKNLNLNLSDHDPVMASIRFQTN